MKSLLSLKTILALIILICVFIIIVVIYKSTTKESEVIINDTTFKVKGIYGDEFIFLDVESIELNETMPKIITKTNGAGIGDIQKGNYELEELGNCKLYVHSNNGPFIIMKIKDIHVIINYSDKAKTEKLYNDLSQKFNT